MYYLNNPRINHNDNLPIFFDIIRRFYSNTQMTDKEVSEKFINYVIMEMTKNIVSPHSDNY